MANEIKKANCEFLSSRFPCEIFQRLAKQLLRITENSIHKRSMHIKKNARTLDLRTKLKKLYYENMRQNALNRKHKPLVDAITY